MTVKSKVLGAADLFCDRRVVLGDTERGLIGRFFLTFDDDGKLEFQGQIIGSPEAEFYLCQLFSAFTGEPTCQIITRVNEMAGWRCYASAGKWRSAHQAHSAAGER